MTKILDIAQVGHPVLREPTMELSLDTLAQKETQLFIDELIATMRAANGAGLAANQVHRSLRICVIEVLDNPVTPTAQTSRLPCWLIPFSRLQVTIRLKIMKDVLVCLIFEVRCSDIARLMSPR